MRHIRVACGVVAAVGAFCVAAVPAFAEESFVANIPGKTISPEKPAKATGKSEEPQVFKFGPKFTFKCQQSPFPENREVGKTVVANATVEHETSSELEVGLKFQKCGRYATGMTEEFTPATIKGKLTVIYHINGFVHLEANEEGEEFEYDKGVEVLATALTIKVPAAKQCTIIIPEQTIPLKAVKHPEEQFSAAVYSNEFTPTGKKGFVNGEKESLIIANEFKKMKYRFAEETQCGVEQPHEEGTEGSYTGGEELSIATGNLGVTE